jgi:hypothetical protein
VKLNQPKKWYEDNLPHDNPEVGVGRTFSILTSTGFVQVSTSTFPKKKGFKYLWGIRHIRYFYIVRNFNKHMRMCIRAGLGFFPQESDLMHLQMIWEGKA